MFELLADGLGVGENAPAGWQRLADQPVVILVGGMGSGKSTLLSALHRTRFPHHPLPDRRVLTNQLIVAPQLREAGLPVTILSRTERLPYIWRYQEIHPEGMAYILSQMWVDLDQVRGALFFDGLRGEEEVRFALENMPNAHFFCLSCPIRVRLERLLERHDPYDRFGPQNLRVVDQPEHFADLGLSKEQLEHADHIFPGDDQKALLALVSSGEVTSLELRQRLSLILEEVRMYNIPEAIAFLERRAGRRVIVVNTQLNLPEAVTTRLLMWLATNNENSKQKESR